MARGVSRDEMADAVTLIPAVAPEIDPDLEDSYEQWRTDTRASETPATLRLYRVPTDASGAPLSNSKHQGELFTAPLDMFTYEQVVEKLRREFIRSGQDSITVRMMGVRKRTDSEPSRIIFNRIVTIEKAAESARKNGEDSISEVARILQEQFNRQMELMQRMIENRPQTDPVQLALQMTQAMTGMVAAMAGGSANRSSLKEVIEMAALMRGANSGGSNLKETIDAIVSVKGLLGDLSGADHEPDDSTAGVIKAASPLVAPVMEALAAYQKNQAEARRLQSEKIASRRKALAGPSAQVQPVQGVRVGEQSAPVNLQPATEKSQEENIMLKTIREQLETLTQIASENGDPKPLAETLMSLIPEEYDEQVLNFLDSPKCLDVLCALHPKVKEQKEWFQSFVEACLAQYVADEPTQPEVSGRPVQAARAEFKSEHNLSPQSVAILKQKGDIK